MEFSINRVNALVTKEIKDLKKNTNILILSVIPILASIIFKKNGMLGLSMCLNMNATMIVCATMSMLIAEEKEKNTMRTLMLSAVSPLEFLISKAIITLVLSIIINIAMFLIIGISSQYLLQFLIIGLILSISMIFIGAVIGLIFKNQMSTSNASVPISLIFLALPAYASSNKTVEIIAKFIPTYHSNELLDEVLKGESLISGMTHLLVLFIWIVLAGIFFGYVYKKRRLQDL
ncbi:ABC transporter permease [Oceanirhabdus seepicola]|uniref:ABC transporter permease n=1 Tax=Oceanirhabdus seepicola TaxID=2828781 RepID=A0A9J6P8Q6_9CLOT|nr:ABC transporter permease [Oceanirhabdus seepicola]MCM1991816.1 ABC transporter permease [Oceanirhabdus seepicola]